MAPLSQPCPDRTTAYLLSLQSKYREDDIAEFKATPATLQQILPQNSLRVLITVAIQATARADIYLINSSGTAVLYASSSTPFSVTITQQLHFTLPTFVVAIKCVNNDDVSGVTIVKT